MKSLTLKLLCGAALLGIAASSQAVPTFGASARGQDLFTGSTSNGGPGNTNASVSEPSYSASADLVSTSTLLPELGVFATNSSPANDDDRTSSTAEGYQTFRTTAAGRVDLNINLHGIVVGDASLLADIYVYGGPDFEVTDSPICDDNSLGRAIMLGSAYFCGSQLIQRVNLFIGADSGEVDLQPSPPRFFDAAAGDEFGIYAILRAGAKDGTANGTETLSIRFEDDSFITPLDTPTAALPLPGTLLLMVAGLIGIRRAL